VLRRVENVKVTHQAGFFTGRGWMTLTIGKQIYRVAKMGTDEFEAMASQEERAPVAVGRVGERSYWWFQRRFYSDNDGLSQSQIYALLITRQQREQQRIAIAQATVAVGATPQSSSRGAIPDDVKQYVWARDGGRCRSCGSGVELQFDHVIPIALGGSSIADNLQVLCGPCNRRKGAGLTTGQRSTNAPSPVPSPSPPTPLAQGQPWWKQPGLHS
jgi:5-methylcytosine-specific restriction endonuclease McrA